MIEETPPKSGLSQGKETVIDATDTRPTGITKSTSLQVCPIQKPRSWMYMKNTAFNQVFLCDPQILVPRGHSDPQNLVPGGHNDP